MPTPWPFEKRGNGKSHARQGPPCKLDGSIPEHENQQQLQPNECLSESIALTLRRARCVESLPHDFFRLPRPNSLIECRDCSRDEPFILTRKGVRLARWALEHDDVFFLLTKPPYDTKSDENQSEANKWADATGRASRGLH